MSHLQFHSTSSVYLDMHGFTPVLRRVLFEHVISFDCWIGSLCRIYCRCSISETFTLKTGVKLLVCELPYKTHSLSCHDITDRSHMLLTQATDTKTLCPIVSAVHMAQSSQHDDKLIEGHEHVNAGPVDHGRACNDAKLSSLHKYKDSQPNCRLSCHLSSTYITLFRSKTTTNVIFRLHMGLTPDCRPSSCYTLQSNW